MCNIGSGYARNTELPASAGSHNRARYQLFLEGKLREEYETNYFFGPERLRAALDSGELIEDPWLADFVRPRSNHA